MSKQLESQPYTAWQLIKAYWQSEQRLVAYSFLMFVIAFSIVIVSIEVGLNYWYNYFYDALQERPLLLIGVDCEIGAELAAF